MRLTKAKLIEIGDIYYGPVLPWVDFDHGGDVIRLGKVLKRLIDFPGIKTIVPGHGKVIGFNELKDEQKVIDQTLASVRQGMIQGLSIKEIQNKGIGPEWKSWEWVGNSIPSWIESVQRSLLMNIPSQIYEGETTP